MAKETKTLERSYTLQDVIDLLTGAKDDEHKLFTNGVKKAGVRLRKATKDASDMLKAIKKDSMEAGKGE